MLLRVATGKVASGRENEFVAICRAQVAADGRAPGLVAFIPGYRRSDGLEQFVLVSTWQTDEDALRVAGPAERSRATTVLGDVATIERIDHYDLIEPAFAGLVDAPGGVVRVTSAFLKTGMRDDFLGWLYEQSRTSPTRELVLGWALGERVVDGRHQVISVSVFPSPLVIEALIEPGREQAPLVTGADGFVDDVKVETYRTIGLDLPAEMADISARRILAARFATHAQCETASTALAARIASAAEVPIAMAPLGAPGSDIPSWILVARVSAADYPSAERLIADSAGDVVFTGRDVEESEPDAGAQPQKRVEPTTDWSATSPD